MTTPHINCQQSRKSNINYNVCPGKLEDGSVVLLIGLLELHSTVPHAYLLGFVYLASIHGVAKV
jgi:hypothetical protein